MSITAKVIEHSINEYGGELLSVECRFPRIILAELNKHRVFSGSSASSRAIPLKKMIFSVKEDMFEPLYWGKNKSGMQADEELTGWRLFAAKTVWRLAAHTACFYAGLLGKIGLHKQIANRLIENFSYVTVLISATEWNNFFNLRYHRDAQPEMKTLAKAIYEAKQASKPRLLKYGEWHLPYVTEEERNAIDIDDLKIISSARIASTSYKTVDGQPMSIERAKKISKKLFGGEILHMSPTEPVATPDKKILVNGKLEWCHPEFHGNFTGFIQYRKTFKNENLSEKFTPPN